MRRLQRPSSPLPEISFRPINSLFHPLKRSDQRSTLESRWRASPLRRRKSTFPYSQTLRIVFRRGTRASQTLSMETPPVDLARSRAREELSIFLEKACNRWTRYLVAMMAWCMSCKYRATSSSTCTIPCRSETNRFNHTSRGKRFFRKFAEQDQPEDQIESLGEDDDGSQISRPLTRSSVQPRLLFPTPKMTEEDEEALTDVEDMNIAEPAPQTPRKPRSLSTKTPEAPRFAPASPPDTRRTTRSANKLSETPMKAAGRKSPFDSWPRTKEHKTQLPVTKRSGESLASADTKRSRA